MDGKDEGVYPASGSQPTISSILSSPTTRGIPRFTQFPTSAEHPPRSFESTFTSSDHWQKLEDGEHKYDLKIGSRTHVLYQLLWLRFDACETTRP